MIWIMMEKQELAHLRIKRERNDAAERAVPPTNVLRVLLIGILRIQDHYVAALEELNHLCALGSGKIARFFLADSVTRGELHFEQLVGLRSEEHTSELQ